MRTVETTVHITEGGMLTAQVPADIPLGEHRAVLLIDEPTPALEPDAPLLPHVWKSGKGDDADIVATMQVHGIRRLLTHNTDDFARFAGLITVVPRVYRVVRLSSVSGRLRLGSSLCWDVG